MALLGKGVAAIWHDIGPEAEPDYHHWHCHEHIPERVGIDGFLRGRRYVGISGAPAFFHFYETESLATLTSKAYLDRLDDPTPWTRRVIPNFRNANRTLCEVVCSQGLGGGAAIATLQLDVADESGLRSWLCGELFPELVRQRGIVGAHLMRGDESASRTPTEEKAMRERPDQISAWVAFVEALETPYLNALRETVLSDQSLRAHGVTSSNVGIYGLHYTLTDVDIKSAGV